MAEVDNVHGGGDVNSSRTSVATQKETRKYAGDALVAGSTMCIMFVLLGVLSLLSISVVGVIVSIINLFCLWYWIPSTITFFKVWKACLNFSSK